MDGLFFWRGRRGFRCAIAVFVPFAESVMTVRSGTSTMTVAAILLAASTIASRVLGYVRDVIIATTLGASAETDAYYAAFLLPDALVYFLAGGALSIAFVPIFIRLKEQKGETEAWMLFRNIGTVGTCLLAVGLLLCYSFTPELVRLYVPDFTEAQHALTVRLTRIILPAPIFFYLGGLLGATEVAGRRFQSTALAPLVYNGCIILGGLLLAPWIGVEGFSWGVLAGAVLGPFGTNYWFARKHVDLRPYINLQSSELRGYFIITLPLMLGVGLTTVDEWFGRYFASGFEPGSISWLNNARRLMLFPIALLGQAIGQAALPFLSKLAHSGDEDGFHASLRGTLASTALLSAAVATGLAALATVAVGLVYGYGAYSPRDVHQTGLLLAAFCLAVPAWSLQAVAARGFYARSETLTPMLASTLAVVISLPLYQFLTIRYGVVGLALAAGVAISGQLILVVMAYQWKYNASLWASIIPYTVRGILSALPGSVVAWLLVSTYWSSDANFGTTLWVSIVGSLAYAVCTIPLLLAFGGDAAHPVRARLSSVLDNVRTP